MTATARALEHASEPDAAAALHYVLVTPARNEADYIEGTIRSVIAQRKRPLCWVIVDDGSTDETGNIVQRYVKAHSWIETVRTPPRAKRDFAGKVHAFNAGYARLRGLDYEIIGSLDADISFDEGYFEVILSKFAADEQLGVAGTPFQEDGRQYDYRYTNIEHVSGACQMFRRQCFESIGGYRAVAGGGIDWIAVTTARMNGWKTRTFTDTFCTHHRPMGTADKRGLAVNFRLGRKDYRLGGHPVWEFLRGIHQMRAKPYGIGGLALMSGFYWDFLRQSPKSVTAELQRFHQAEQMRRLGRQLSRWRHKAVTGASPSR